MTFWLFPAPLWRLDPPTNREAKWLKRCGFMQGRALCSKNRYFLYPLISGPPKMLRFGKFLDFLHAAAYMLLRVYAIARPSVYPSVTWVDQSKTARITKFSPYSSPIPLVFWQPVSSQNSEGSPRAGALNDGGVGKIGHFRTVKCDGVVCCVSVLWW